MTSLSSLRSKPWILASLLAVWVVAVSIPLMIKMGGHYAALPGPMSHAGLAGTNEWKATHVLSAECGCSGVVARYLASRKAEPSLKETVWILDGSAEWEEPLRAAGFDVVHRSAEQLAEETGVQGVPWLLLRQENQPLAYSGGYSSEPPRPGGNFQDLAIWRALTNGSSAVKALPSYGCATSQRLKAFTDPFVLKTR